MWLVGSTALDDGGVASVTALLRDAPTLDGGAVTDGRLTVGVDLGGTGGGLPTPFDVS